MITKVIGCNVSNMDKYAIGDTRREESARKVKSAREVKYAREREMCVSVD